MKCRTCEKELSLTNKTIVVTNGYPINSMEIIACDDAYICLSVVCPNCITTHVIKYGFPFLVNAYQAGQRVF